MSISKITTICCLAASALAYSTAAVTSLAQLGGSINQTNSAINHLEGCGYLNTTSAITSHAPVTSGSACPSADNTIANDLNTTNTQLQSVISSLQESRSSTEASSAQTIAAFNEFADAFYALFNAMDLAECTYVLTTESQSFVAQFGAGGLKDSFNGLAQELSASGLELAVQVLGPNLKQQTHFVGTSFLATQVGGLEPVALAGCELITGIVVSEGGGSG